MTSPTQHSQHAQVQGYGYILFAPLGGRVVELTAGAGANEFLGVVSNKKLTGWTKSPVDGTASFLLSLS